MEDDPARAREKREAEREEFFAQLDVDGVSEKETALKEVVWEVLEQKGGTCRLNYIAADYRVKQKKTAFLPKSLNISVWIQRRMGDVMSVEPDPVAKDNQIVSFLDPSLVTAASEAAAAAGTKQEQRTSSKSKGKASGKWGKEGMWGKDGMWGKGGMWGKEGLFGKAGMWGKGCMWGKGGKMDSFALAPFMAGKGKFSPPVNWGYDMAMMNNAKGQGKYAKGGNASSNVGKGKLSQESSSKGKGKTAEDEEYQAFFDNLPPSDFTFEEVTLMSAMLTRLEELGVNSARLNLVIQDHNVLQAKRGLLPPSVKITHWISNRAASKFALEPDPKALGNQILRIVDADGQPAVDDPVIEDAPTFTAIEGSAVASDMLKNRSSRDAFLQTLPPDHFTDDESSLLVAITTKVQAMGGRARLNEVSTDEKIKLAKKRLLPNGVGIKMWAESRATEHLSIEPDPVAQNNQIVSIVIPYEGEPGAKRMRLQV